MTEPIKFISDQRYRWMSNFYEAPIRWKRQTFPTVEHGFQYLKTRDRQWQKRIRTARTPMEAKKLGRQCPMRPDWDDIKVNCMMDLVRQKFQQHPELKEQLLATGQRPIQEDAHWDSFWGTGRDGRGRNMMGKILKRIRKELADD